MNIFLYIIIFVMGTVFGSFYTLAVYRLPKKIDITHTHSFCPNCKHQLGFFELIPVWSYLFLGGRCKNCKQRIRPRYFIIEICSGLIFVLIALGLKINVYHLYWRQLVEILFFILYLSAIIIIAGIDKEKRQIQRGVIYYVLGVLLTYIIYLCIVGEPNIYRYVMYLSIVLILLIIDTLNLKKKADTSYLLSILMLVIVMEVFTGEIVTILTITMTLLTIGIYTLFKKISNATNRLRRVQEQISNSLRIGFFLCVSNIVISTFAIFFVNWTI